MTYTIRAASKDSQKSAASHTLTFTAAWLASTRAETSSSQRHTEANTPCQSSQASSRWWSRRRHRITVRKSMSFKTRTSGAKPSTTRTTQTPLTTRSGDRLTRTRKTNNLNSAKRSSASSILPTRRSQTPQQGSSTIPSEKMARRCPRRTSPGSRPRCATGTITCRRSSCLRLGSRASP